VPRNGCLTHFGTNLNTRDVCVEKISQCGQQRYQLPTFSVTIYAKDGIVSFCNRNAETGKQQLLKNSSILTDVLLLTNWIEDRALFAVCVRFRFRYLLMLRNRSCFESCGLWILLLWNRKYRHPSYFSKRIHPKW